ncbi:MAG TPA: SUF system NifU family Fe-S cluster assembly protein, partial [Myxococcota bacterium]|nr:SUF system NifU family Fe-S cluster assembly protein [Myxococcota bacterium]
MDDLRDLYQATILDHNKKPRNFRVLEDATHEADGHNPLCGDQLTVYARVGEDGRIEEITFKGSGCAISKASASLMTEALEGRTLEEAHAAFDRFHDLVTSSPSAEAPIEELGKLAVFAG